MSLTNSAHLSVICLLTITTTFTDISNSIVKNYSAFAGTLESNDTAKTVGGKKRLKLRH